MLVGLKDVISTLREIILVYIDAHSPSVKKKSEKIAFTLRENVNDNYLASMFGRGDPMGVSTMPETTRAHTP
jgi:hypothetical protein